MSESRLRVKRFSLLGIFLLSLALLLTFSRASWLNFIIGCFLIAVLTKKYKLLIFLGFFTFFILLIPPFNHRFFYTFQSAFGGLSSRQEIWNLAWKMIGESPILGKGVGTFMDYSLAYSGGKNATYTHNCFLQIWAETGIIALLAFLLFSVSLLLKGWSVFKRSRNFQLLGWGCAFFTLLLASFLDTQLYSLQLSAFFWTVAGLLFAACQTN
jgi:O-antigen ligase